MFLLQLTALNLEAEPITANLYVVLDPGICEYWFWPSLAHWPPDIASMPVSLESGAQQTFEVLNFTLPDTSDLPADAIA
jgi:hypothetical protein